MHNVYTGLNLKDEHTQEVIALCIRKEQNPVYIFGMMPLTKRQVDRETVTV